MLDFGKNLLNKPVPVNNSGSTTGPSPVPAAPAKPNSGSPWDEKVDESIEPKPVRPTEFGSLDDEEENPDSGPLKVPTDVPENVGTAEPAQKYIDNEKPAPNQNIAPSPPPPQNISPPNPPATPLYSPPPAPSTPPVQNIPPVPQNVPPKKTGFFGKLFKKDSPPPKNAISIQPPATPPPPSIAPAQKQQNPKSGKIFTKHPKLIIIFGFIVFLFFLVFLTEYGFVSVGVEKIYGAVGTEQLWGGLSKNPEAAIGRSALVMQNHPNFKVNGSITLTVNRSVKSPVITPLLSLAGDTLVLRDIDQSQKTAVKATKTVDDAASVDDYYIIDDTDTTKSTGSDSSSATTDTTTDTAIDTTGQAATPATDSGEESIMQLDVSVSGDFSEDAAETNLKITKEGNESKVDLINSDGKLYVKSDYNIKFAGNSDPSTWLEYNLQKLSGKMIQKDFFAYNSDTGFSAKGLREGNEVVGGVRCYKYKVDELEIGNSLSSLGITSDMIQIVSGEVWIGVRDKLIRKVDLNIVSPISSAVSLTNVKIEFSDYDTVNSITIPTNAVAPGGTVEAGVGTGVTTAQGDAKRKEDVTAILVALKKYKDSVGSYPISSSLLKLNTKSNIIKNALVPQYLAAIPVDPKDAEGWYYAYKSDGVKCSVSARLENTADTEGQSLSGTYLYLKYNYN